ncbi:putative 3-oxoacyl-[acyl-carrier-protein] reductase, chloroplastic-like [Capsicum annuum]|nr:putative 3-oxoacyl-[acyl-carrier-protein] reductase, chloroplastic-like [Capsicum annuum]KAF3643831.1 putative 3-oxoacyl-[acyl-carrier-protein] reductase, chloroplastic-like [Capsicum annuum]
MDRLPLLVPSKSSSCTGLAQRRLQYEATEANASGPQFLEAPFLEIIAMESKKGKGRQKIPMKKIEKQDDRYVTFSKRRSGLYKKASELVKECDVDIGMMFFSPTGNPFAFFHPTVDAVVSRFQNPDLKLSESTQLVAAQARNRVNGLQSGLDELDLREDIAIANKNVYDKVLETTQKSKWESIEQLNAEELTKFEAWLNVTRFNLQNRLNQLENGASSSFGY